jgi:peptide/nickel transport system permease protein
MKKPLGAVSLVLLILLLLACFFPGQLTRYQPDQIDFSRKFTSPGRQHLMGTDELGRDVFTRILYGGRATLGSALVIAGGTTFTAALWAAVSVYLGGIWDELLTRMVDLLMIIPGLLLALILVSILEPGMPSLVLALVIARWPGYARILRGQLYSLKGQDFLLAAEAVGARPLRIIWRHFLPNARVMILTVLGLSFASGIISISSLNFLGFGVQLPHPEWGAMVNAARPFLQTRPYLMVFPGAAIVASILLTNLSLSLLEPEK